MNTGVKDINNIGELYSFNGKKYETNLYWLMLLVDNN